MNSTTVLGGWTWDGGRGHCLSEKFQGLRLGETTRGHYLFPPSSTLHSLSSKSLFQGLRGETTPTPPRGSMPGGWFRTRGAIMLPAGPRGGAPSLRTFWIPDQKTLLQSLHFSLSKTANHITFSGLNNSHLWVMGREPPL